MKRLLRWKWCCISFFVIWEGIVPLCVEILSTVATLIDLLSYRKDELSYQTNKQTNILRPKIAHTHKKNHHELRSSLLSVSHSKAIAKAIRVCRITAQIWLHNPNPNFQICLILAKNGSLRWTKQVDEFEASWTSLLYIKL